jgi:hypothetical protein
MNITAILGAATDRKHPNFNPLLASMIENSPTYGVIPSLCAQKWLHSLPAFSAKNCKDWQVTVTVTLVTW